MNEPIERALLTVLNAEGKAVASYRLDAQRLTRLVLGRSLACDVVIDDPHLAAQHAELSLDQSGVLRLRDLDTLNGIHLDDQKVSDATLSQAGSHTLLMGLTSLRVHAEGATITPERLLPDSTDDSLSKTKFSTAHWIERFNSRRLFFASSALTLAWLTFNGWSQQTTVQRDIWVSIVNGVLGLAVIALIWVALWALISRVSNGKPRWTIHACIALTVGLISWLVERLFEFGAFTLSAIVPGQVQWWWLALVGSLLLFLHLRAATHLRAVRALSLAVFLPAALIGMTYWQAYGTQSGREARQTSSVSLYPPSLRIVKPDAPESLFNEAKAMKPEVIRLRDKAQEEGAEGAPSDDD